MKNREKEPKIAQIHSKLEKSLQNEGEIITINYATTS